MWSDLLRAVERIDQARSPGFFIKAMRTLVSHLHESQDLAKQWDNDPESISETIRVTPFITGQRARVCEVEQFQRSHCCPLYHPASHHGLCFPHVPMFLGSPRCMWWAPPEDSHKAGRTWVLPPRFPRVELLSPQDPGRGWPWGQDLVEPCGLSCLTAPDWQRQFRP